PDVGRVAEELIQQPAQMWIAHRPDQAFEVFFHLVDLHRRPVEQVGDLVFACACRDERLDRQLRPEAVGHGVTALDAHRSAGLGEVVRIGGAFPADGGNPPGRVGKSEAQEVLAVLLLPQGAVPDEEYAVDDLAVGEVADELAPGLRAVAVRLEKGCFLARGQAKFTLERGADTDWFVEANSGFLTTSWYKDVREG